MSKKEIPIEEAGEAAAASTQPPVSESANTVPDMADDTTTATMSAEPENATPPTPVDPLEEARKKEAELIDSLKRLAAEFDNYRKKNAGEYSRGLADGMSQVIEAILPALDSLRLATESTGGAAEAEAIRKGVEAVSRQIGGILSGLGLEEVVAKPGDALDPNVHEVLFAEPSDTVDPGRVIQIFQTGYRFRSRLLRAAKVKVAAEKPAARADDQPRVDVDA